MPLTALDVARETALRHGISPEEFRARISQCFAHGYVFSTPSEFMAAEPCEHNGQRNGWNKWSGPGAGRRIPCRLY